MYQNGEFIRQNFHAFTSMMKKIITRKYALIVSGIFLGCLVYLILLPLPENVRSGSSQRPLKILDRSGQLLYEFRRGAPGSQDFLPYKEIPETAISALVDTEDRTFFSHHGVSFRGTLRALYQNVTSGKVVSGGSTITQQLIRIRRQSSRSIFSKILESWYALRLEMKQSKEQILEIYLNETVR